MHAHKEKLNYLVESLSFQIELSTFWFLIQCSQHFHSALVWLKFELSWGSVFAFLFTFKKPHVPSSSKYKIISIAARKKVFKKTCLNFGMKLSPCWDVLVQKNFFGRVSLAQIFAFCHFTLEYTWTLHLNLGKHPHQSSFVSEIPAQKTERVIFLDPSQFGNKIQMCQTRPSRLFIFPFFLFSIPHPSFFLKATNILLNCSK